MLYDADTGELIADLVYEGQQVVVARGGKGGRGNARFATAKNRAPRKFEEGKPGEERTIQLELKSIADVGLVGFPSRQVHASKGISRAKRKWPVSFTTHTPSWWVEHDGERFVVADIPGLIEGASQGRGLGYESQHIEGT